MTGVVHAWCQWLSLSLIIHHCLCLSIWCLEKSEQDFCWGICRLVIAAISVVMKGTADIKLYLSTYPFWRERERLFHLRVWDKKERRQEQNIMAHMWAASAAATLKKNISSTKALWLLNHVLWLTRSHWNDRGCHCLEVCCDCLLSTLHLSFLKLHRNEY